MFHALPIRRIGSFVLAFILTVVLPIAFGDGIGIARFLNLQAFLATIVAPVLMAFAIYGPSRTWKSLFLAKKTELIRKSMLRRRETIRFVIRSSRVMIVVFLIITVNIDIVLAGGSWQSGDGSVHIVLIAILYSALSAAFWWMPLLALTRKDADR